MPSALAVGISQDGRETETGLAVLGFCGALADKGNDPRGDTDGISDEKDGMPDDVG